jgi:hypothetical protein
VLEDRPSAACERDAARRQQRIRANWTCRMRVMMIVVVMPAVVAVSMLVSGSGHCMRPLHDAGQYAHAAIAAAQRLHVPAISTIERDGTNPAARAALAMLSNTGSPGTSATRLHCSQASTICRLSPA